MSKGQVTAFIIIGIVILAIVAGVLLLRNQIIRTGIERQRASAIIVPDQIKPVQLFINDCVNEVSREAIDIVSFQGGYIELPDDNFAVTPANPFSNSLRLNENSGARVAYWSYQAGNGIKNSNVPGLDDIEKRIEAYVEVNLAGCLDDIDEVFSSQGYNITRRQVDNVNANAFDNDVEVIVQQPILVRYKDIDFTIDKHIADIDKPLGRFYDIALDIYEDEEASYFLEEKTIDMFVVYDELPYSGTDFECSPRIWTKSKVESDFKTVIGDNIARLRVEGSNYNLANDENSYFELDLLDENNDDVNIGFRYSGNWPVTLDISPSDGELLKGESINMDVGNDLEGFLTSLFCINNYHFVYDVKYPVLVTISNDDYSFQYATQVIIDNNQPRENLLGEEEVIKTDEICQNTGERIGIDTVVENVDGKFLPLDKVDVSYKCITVTCNIGESENGRIEANFPACLNGVAIGSKEGYTTARNLVSTNQAGEATLVLKPLYTKQLEVMLIDKDTGEVRKPYDSEKVIFEFDGDYDASVVWPDNNEVTLAPGGYNVRSYVIGSSTWDIMIAEREIESCVEVPNGFLGIFGNTKEECRKVKIPGTTLEEIIKGGANFDLNIDHFDIARSNTMVVYTIVDDIPATYEELADRYDQIEDNAFDAKFRYPEFR